MNCFRTCKTNLGLVNGDLNYVGPYFDLFQTKNVRFADFAHADYVEFICRKRSGMQTCATLGFVFTVEKSGLS